MKLKHTIVALTMLFSAGWQCSNASAQTVTNTSYSWKNVAISGGGFISGVIYHPVQWGLIYARTDMGGAYRWSTSKSAWTPLTDQFNRADDQLMGVLSMAIDPANSNLLYLATGEYTPSWAHNAALLRSSDQGATWNRTELPFKLGGNEDGRSTGERLQVDPGKGSILFLGTSQDGLWKSTDSAQSWSKVTSFTASSVTFVLFDKKTSNNQTGTSTIYVGVNSTTSASLYRSTDSGNSWSAVSGQPLGLIPHHAGFDNNGVLYLTYSNQLGPNNITNGAVWKYVASTGTWQDISPVIPGGWDNFGYGGLAIDTLRTGTLLVSTYDRWGVGDDIFRSNDSGATWKALAANAQYDSSSTPWVSKHTSKSMGHWIGGLAIDPFNSNNAIYVTGGGLWSTTNLINAGSGLATNWKFSDKGIEETAVMELASPPSGASLLSVMADIDGFYHDDLTASPSRGAFNGPYGTSQGLDFAEANPSIVVRTNVSSATRGYRSIDGGQTWLAFGSAPQAAVTNGIGKIAVSSNGANIVWMPSLSGAYYSKDGGTTWRPSSGSPNDGKNNFIPVADRVNSNKFYIYDKSAGNVYRSVDGGMTFALTARGLPIGGSIMRAVAGGAYEGNLWLPTNSGLYRSTDSGLTFAPVAGVQKANAVGFGMAAPGQSHPVVYLIGTIANVEGFYRSNNAGATWVRINDASRQFSGANIIIGDPRVYGRAYVGTNGRGILYGEPTTP